MPENLNVNKLKNVKAKLSRFMMSYKFAIDEINTKINILREEYTHLHEYNPIENVSSRIKTPESIIKKVTRKNIEPSIESIKEEIRDIAGVRITCSFVSGVYEVKHMLERQQDVEVLEYKDYIDNPKPNGYRSLHMLIEIPIYLSDRVENIPVEIQIRTIAMDFWASLEHKIFYKYNKDVPQSLLAELKEAATIATNLDFKMERLNKEINIYKENDLSEESVLQLTENNEHTNLSSKLLEYIFQPKKGEIL